MLALPFSGMQGTPHHNRQDESTHGFCIFVVHPNRLPGAYRVFSITVGVYNVMFNF